MRPSIASLPSWYVWLYHLPILIRMHYLHIIIAFSIQRTTCFYYHCLYSRLDALPGHPDRQRADRCSVSALPCCLACAPWHAQTLFPQPLPGMRSATGQLDSLCEAELLLSSTRRLPKSRFPEYPLRGSNPRPMAHKTIALTTELRELVGRCTSS